MAERPEAHINLGNLHTDAGAVDQAEAAYRLALKLEPRAVAARVNLAELYVQNDRGAEAEQLLRDGIAMQADAAILHHALGLMLVRGNRRDAALAELAAAASLQPDEPRFIYVFAVALNSLERPEKAIELLHDASGRFPADFDIHWALVTMLRDQGRLGEAREVATTLSGIYPQVEAVRNLLQSL
jgi:predicted Zn-dependent protease